jgi:MFS family permease
MASVAVILLLGRAYGLFNIKYLLLSSIATFEVGSALCGAAPSMSALIIGRVIAGIGGAGMYLGALTYISVFATNKEASLYNALIGLAWGLGAILGPVIGGAFSVGSATWRWAFYINLPLAGLFSPVYFFIMPSRNPRPDLTLVQKLAEIDWVGAILNGALFVLFMIACTFGGSTYAWNSGSSIALWVVFGVCLISYILQQYLALFTTAERRIFPVHFIKSRTMLLLYIGTAGAAAANAVTLYYVPLFFQFTRGDSALQAAVRLLPFICLFIFSVMVAGGLLPVLGRYNIFYIIGGALSLAGGALMFTIDANTSTSHIYGYEILIAAGTGLVFQNAYAVAAAKVPDKDKAKAIGFINVAQIGTIAIALAIAGSLFQNLGFKSLKSAFEGYHYPDDYVRSALAGNISPIFSSANPDVIHIAVVTVATTIQRVFGVVVAAGALTFASALLMRWERVDLDVVAGG